VNEVQRYWRDKVVNLFQWGAALSVLLAGWAIQSQEKFQLLNASWPRQRDEILGAIGLLTVVILCAPLLPLAVRYIYKNFLDKETDETVLSYRFAMMCAVVLAVVDIAITLLMCLV
jgi:hypothetical protein